MVSRVLMVPWVEMVRVDEVGEVTVYQSALNPNPNGPTHGSFVAPVGKLVTTAVNGKVVIAVAPVQSSFKTAN